MAVEHSYTSDESSAANLQQPTKPEMRPAAEVFGFLLEKRRPSPISAEAPSDFIPATQNAIVPVNHTHAAPTTTTNSKKSPSLPNTQPAGVSASTDAPSSDGDISIDPPYMANILNHTRVPVPHGRLSDGSPVGRLTVTPSATRASRIPRSRRSLQLPDSTTLNPETQLLTTPSKEPALTVIRNNYDILRSATNTTERAHVATSRLTDVKSALAPKRGAHRRSTSCGTRGLIPNDWSAPDTTGSAHLRGLKFDENSNPISATKNVGLYSSGKPKSRLPVTPSHERVLLSSIPTPDSSTELSPLGRKMMADLRKQRRVRGERQND
ncbi:hypothetical protein EI94DRAFT_1726833 [Lactarius quietus]|nr:hypothetical protein EI94DRAFT_1726833 [Lactarius quietus]